MQAFLDVKPPRGLSVMQAFLDVKPPGGLKPPGGYRFYPSEGFWTERKSWKKTFRRINKNTE
jgi:hypothetical protein